MQLRLAQTQDFAQWLVLWDAYQSFYKVSIPAATTELTWKRFHDPAEPVHCAVAERDGRLVGMVHYLFHRSCWTAADSCYLQDLFTAPEARGMGIGRALIQHVYAKAAEAGVPRVWWLTHETNAQAMRLYDQVADKSGFLQYCKTIA
jgi:GNAT superfamily N-acetyltransferase